MRKTNSLSTLIFVVILAVGLASAYSSFALSEYVASALIVGIALIVAWIVSYSVKVADQWERVVVLRLGRFRALVGPGLFFIIPRHEQVA